MRFYVQTTTDEESFGDISIALRYVYQNSYVTPNYQSVLGVYRYFPLVRIDCRTFLQPLYILLEDRRIQTLEYTTNVEFMLDNPRSPYHMHIKQRGLQLTAIENHQHEDGSSYTNLCYGDRPPFEPVQIRSFNKTNHSTAPINWQEEGF